MKGKERCRILKEIRQKIADENKIEYITSECKHKGDCLGTCPKCEAEVRYLERELERKQRMGKSIAVAGIAASLVLTGVSCADETVDDNLGGDLVIEETIQGDLRPAPEDELMGEPVAPDTPYFDEEGNELTGPSVEVPGELVDYFFPEKPEEYDEYSQEFINASMANMTIDEIKKAWGEGDMYQVIEDRGIVAYFTSVQDIVVQYDVATGAVINVATINNAE